jgi:hypothetical protein
MPDRSEPSGPHVYQIKVRLLRIIPMVWRRFLISDQETLGELHRAVQVAFGWTDAGLHRFDIHGRSYGLSRPGDLPFNAEADQVSLASLQLREGGTFRYTYNFTDGWEHDIRLERRLPHGKEQSVPICTGGSGRGPVEGCGGPWAYQKLIATYKRAPLSEYLRLCVRLGELFNPFAFDRQDVNEKLQSGDGPRKTIQLGESPKQIALRKLLALVDPEFEENI